MKTNFKKFDESTIEQLTGFGNGEEWEDDNGDICCLVDIEETEGGKPLRVIFTFNDKLYAVDYSLTSKNPSPFQELETVGYKVKKEKVGKITKYVSL